MQSQSSVLSGAILDSAGTECRPSPVDRVGDLSRQVAERLCPHPGQRREILGDVFLACEQLVREAPAEVEAAARRGRLVDWALARVRGNLHEERSESFRGGWAGLYVRNDAREVESDDADARDDESLDDEAPALGRQAIELSQQALRRAISLAEAEQNQTLLRNLEWYRARLEHKTYDAIARSEGRVPATVRTGVARARKFVLSVVHALRNAQPAPLSGEGPSEIEPLRKLWAAQDLVELEAGLARTEADYGDDPHWLNLKALLVADRGQHTSASELYERALVFADAPAVRGRILNNLGNLADDMARIEEARGYWLRAHQLLPRAPAPLVNLLACASQRHDYASSQHYTALLGDLLSSGHLGDDERSYVCRRLREHPKLGWLKETEAWRQGPARWLRTELPATPALGRIAAACGALLLAVFLTWPGSSAAWASDPDVPGTHVEREEKGGKRGGDSMGGPRRDAGSVTREE